MYQTINAQDQSVHQTTYGTIITAKLNRYTYSRSDSSLVFVSKNSFPLCRFLPRTVFSALKSLLNKYSADYWHILKESHIV